jgi:hypothetical protein
VALSRAQAPQPPREAQVGWEIAIRRFCNTTGGATCSICSAASSPSSNRTCGGNAQMEGIAKAKVAGDEAEDSSGLARKRKTPPRGDEATK